MGYTVTIFEAKPQWIAAARGPLATNISAAMLGLLGQAWDFVKKSGIKTDGQSVAIYRRDAIEAGPRVLEKCEGCVATPSGLTAMTIHMGPYELLGSAHSAVREWCKANGHQLEGTNWEVYGHHSDDPAQRRTDVLYLLRS
jgi:effector-binding domain-containing protein